ncbi:methyltransferase domain-containing protein [Paenibacillus sp. UNC499MF]|uniref:methyltransferase domain-containing protein n=1 Tax=Paenibacillus sp. UNC499MF TaxID=1502751 RepID=UPI0008A0628E|nr:methyltransferase domain-containing protein [Paenibacillus sp. UNC499MF]SEF67500.1 Methyltransferase domain-containing protein [Paenibacillus sp. UNC499MF]
MPPFDRLRSRSPESEYMDDFTRGGAELREALRHLRRLNRLFAAPGPTLYGIGRLWAAAGKPQHLTVLDVGSGSGDINRHVLRWADERKVSVKITLCDITEEACEEARHLFRGEPRVEIRRADLSELPEGCADIVTAAQFLHHFSREDLPDVVRTMLRASRFGIAVNDIHRHWLAWSAVWLASRILSGNRYIRHDGPLSVAKGFSREDWSELRRVLEMPDYHVSWRPLFRYAVVIPRQPGPEADPEPNP